MQRILKFVRDTRAGATAISAVAVTVMVVGGTALITDHRWLVDQRDVLKAAADAGAIAATLEMNRQLAMNPGISDASLKEAIGQVATRYVALNLSHLSGERLTRALSTLEVDAEPNIAAGTVTVQARADLGGTLLSRHLALVSNYKGPDEMRTASIVERTKVPVEVVLAIDVSKSMGAGATEEAKGMLFPPEEQTRIGVVKQAMLKMVALLAPSAHDRMAVGVVPWHYMVRLDSATRRDWAGKDWAQYPSSRYYAVPYRAKSGMSPPRGVTQSLAASAPEPWLGCLNEHRIVNGAGHADWPEMSDLLAPPTTVAFAQAFFPAYAEFAYDCAEEPLPSNLYGQMCYTEVRTNIQYLFPLQYTCFTQGPPLLPLTTDRRVIDDAIKGLQAIGAGTYSTTGMLWAQRMLSHQWKRTWGDPEHPLDSAVAENEGLRKVIVLLTDGEDNYCGDDPGACVDSELGIDRSEACTLAKNAGTEIFVVAAMPPEDVSSDLAQSLRRCSSESDNPGGTYVFINNENEEGLRAAFHEIANQLLELRRVY